MPGLVPGIHALFDAKKAWMAGTSPAMTSRGCDVVANTREAARPACGQSHAVRRPRTGADRSARRVDLLAQSSVVGALDPAEPAGAALRAARAAQRHPHRAVRRRRWPG